MKVTKDKVLAKTPYVKFIERSYEDKNGKKCKWSFAQRNNNRNAVMIIATVGDKLVVTKEYRIPLADFEIGFPAGLVDDGESIEHAAIRELKEETGLDTVEIVRSTPFVFNSAGITDEKIAMVYIKAEGTPSKEFQEEAEDIETWLLTPTEVNEVLCSQFSFSAKAYIEMYEFVRRSNI